SGAWRAGDPVGAVAASGQRGHISLSRPRAGFETAYPDRRLEQPVDVQGSLIVIPGCASRRLRCAMAHPRISRFRARVCDASYATSAARLRGEMTVRLFRRLWLAAGDAI